MHTLSPCYSDVGDRTSSNEPSSTVSAIDTSSKISEKLDQEEDRETRKQEKNPLGKSARV